MQLPHSQALVREWRKNLHMLSSTWISGNLEILLRYTNFRKGKLTSLIQKCLPLTTLCVYDDEGVTNIVSSSLARTVDALIHSSKTLQYVTDAIFPFEIY